MYVLLRLLRSLPSAPRVARSRYAPVVPLVSISHNRARRSAETRATFFCEFISTRVSRLPTECTGYHARVPFLRRDASSSKLWCRLYAPFPSSSCPRVLFSLSLSLVPNPVVIVCPPLAVSSTGVIIIIIIIVVDVVLAALCAPSDVPRVTLRCPRRIFVPGKPPGSSNQGREAPENNVDLLIGDISRPLRV